MKKRKNVLTSLIIFILLVTSLTGCQTAANAENKKASQPIISQNDFASYAEVPVTINPSIKDYQVARNLGNVINKDRFAFSDEAESMLIKNGFLVIPSPMQEFFSIYEMNRYDCMPNFITTDAMLHNYHLYFSYLIRTLEKDGLRGELDTLTKSMIDKSQIQYQSLKGTEWENAAKRNVAYFAVAARLLNPEAKIPSFVSKEVNKELQLIANHQDNFVPSPVMNIGNSEAKLTESFNEDYTQYIPRGHYTKSEDLKTYFKAMMWYGRMNFRSSNVDETKSAVLITLLLDQKDYKHWNNIYEPTNFFVGKSDDLGFNQYYPLLKQAYGKVPSLKQLTGNEKSWNSLLADIKKLDPPTINSMPIFDKSIQSDREKAIKGFRFMGQRFTLDASVFQHLVYREVEKNSKGERRMLPKGLDIPAAMGSQEAYSILKDMGETSYKNYPENMKKIQGHIASMDVKDQTQNLYGAWLYTLTPLTEPKGKGYPMFMQNQAWTRKQLETYMGSYTELKHDTILYAKQVYAEMGGGEEEIDDRGYVEPNPVVYGRLASLTRMTIDGLQSRGLLNENISASLEQLEDLALQLKNISEKELAQKPLTEDEYDLIRSFGGQLEHFWLEALKDEGIDSPSAVAENPAALIADVATDPNGQVLEEGTGYISNIYAIVPVAGSLRIAKGGVYSYYEFPWPSDDRLTDEKWKDMLENEKAPDAPSWTKIYTAPEGSSQW
ncbi:MAG: DUF3160 domain-containing protein [Aminipila sp.]